MYLVHQDQEKHICQKFLKKISKIKVLNAEEVNDELITVLENFSCIIIDNYENNISETLLYSLLNQSKQLDNYILINSINSLKEMSFEPE